MENKDLELFLKEAHFLYSMKKYILIDNQMFFTPIPVRSGLAYLGEEPFKNPILRVYIEWWISCDAAHVVDKDGRESLVYYVAGSPLSGCNSCGIVSANGMTKSHAISPFVPLWSSLMRINCRYAETKGRFKAYSLEETCRRLHFVERKSNER